jgi:hypothetical protein
MIFPSASRRPSAPARERPSLPREGDGADATSQTSPATSASPAITVTTAAATIAVIALRAFLEDETL